MTHDLRSLAWFLQPESWPYGIPNPQLAPVLPADQDFPVGPSRPQDRVQAAEFSAILHGRTTLGTQVPLGGLAQ
jgi:hypothetical protein